jgi:hypothetical protein
VESLSLSNFNSYFELLIAFTFAYAGLPGFKEYLNRVSSREFNDLYEGEIKKLSHTLQLHSDTIRKTFVQDFEKLQTAYIDELTKLESTAKNFFNGTYFQPMFFLTGLVYIFFIIVGGFQESLGREVVFLYVLLVFALSMLYFGFVFLRLFIGVRRNQDFNDKWWLSSYWILPIYFGLCTVLLFLSMFIVHKFSQEISDLADNKHILLQGTFLECRLLFFIETVLVMMALLISIVPYVIYYFRNEMFNATIEKAFTQKEAGAKIFVDALCERITEFHTNRTIINT